MTFFRFFSNYSEFSKAFLYVSAMCGRTACTLQPDQISKLCRYRKKDGSYSNPSWDKNKDKYVPSSNKAPQSYCPVLVGGNHVNPEPCERSLAAMRWGLIPSWFKGSSSDRVSYNMNNARSDTLMEKKSYVVPLRKGQRCVVVADGFYEWNKTRNGKQPYYIYFPQQDGVSVEEGSPNNLLAMAGIFEKTWCDDEEVYSFTIITVDASEDFSWLHHRMPALLVNEREVEMWLDSENVPLDEALTLIKPKTHLQWHPVSKFVNNSRNDGPECIKRVDLDAVKKSNSSSSKGMMRWLRSSQTSSQVSSPTESTSTSEGGRKKKAVTPLDNWVKKKKTSD